MERPKALSERASASPVPGLLSTGRRRVGVPLPPPSHPRLPAANTAVGPSRSSLAPALPSVGGAARHPRSDAESTELMLGEPFSVIGPFGDSLFLFEARHVRTGRRAVAKLFKAAGSARSLATQCSQIASLRHPSTVRMLDVGLANTPPGTGYLVREFIEGVTLGQRLRWGTPLALDEALIVASDLARALTEAHRLGLIHGRLWPEHVILERQRSPHPRARVIGFGPSSGSPSEQATWYLAPELLRGGAPGRTADTYAVGAMLYACLFQKEPGVGGALPEGDSSPLCEVPEVVDFFATALARASGRRFADGGHLLEGLSTLAWALADGEPDTVHALTLTPGPLAYDAGLIAPRDELTADGPASVWLLEGDSAISDAVVQAALAHLGDESEVRVVTAEERTGLLDNLSSGRQAAPWVVVFGDMSVLLEDELLSRLGAIGETSRLLISSHENFELLQNSINCAGLDHHITLPSTPEAISSAIERLVRRTRRIHRYYDNIRTELRRTRTEVGEMSRALTAQAPRTEPPSVVRPRARISMSGLR